MSSSPRVELFVVLSYVVAPAGPANLGPRQALDTTKLSAMHRSMALLKRKLGASLSASSGAQFLASSIS